MTANYKGADQTLEFLESLCRLKRFTDLDVVVVDNASDDDSVPRIRAKISGHDNVSLLESTINRGYFGAAKWALDAYSAEREGFPAWVIVSNNDILIDDREFFDKLISRDSDAVGVIAPQIRSLQSQMDQNPFMEKRLSHWKLIALCFWDSTYFLARLHLLIYRLLNLLRSQMTRLRGTMRRVAAHNGPRRIYAPQGAFMIFSRKYFQSGGYIDDGLFLYGEELSVAEICRTLGLSVIYDPDLRVCHKESETVGRTLSHFAYSCHKEALRYVSLKYLADI